MVLSLKDFLQLDYEGKIQVTNHAVCIGGRSEQEHMVLLYQLNSFYIEVFYNKKFNYISAFKGFDDLELLDPYLEKINISVAY
jgi:hypothetical protein